MSDLLSRLFPPATPTAPAAAPPVTGPQVVTMPEVFPGQAKDSVLLFNNALTQMGRDVIGALPEPTPEIEAHVDAMAVAQGEAWCAAPVDTDHLESDARAQVFRGEADKRHATAEARVDRCRDLVDNAEKEMSDVPPVSRAGVSFGFVLALVGGLAGAVVLNPTVSLLLGGAFRQVVGEAYVKWASLGASLMLGLVPPLLAMGAASARAHWAKIVALGVLELACIGGLAWGRAQLLGAAPATSGLTEAEVAFLASDGNARSAMMLAIEALIVVGLTGLGVQVSMQLVAWDRRYHAEDRARIAREALVAAQAERAEVQAVRLADHELMVSRDVAAERGEKVRKLCRQLIWQGVLEQAQANWDALNDAPRAVVGPRRTEDDVPGVQ